VYLLTRWIDSTPMNNMEQGHPYEGDSLQVRFIAAAGTRQERITHFTAWHSNREKTNRIHLAVGRMFRDHGFVRKDGARQEFVKNKDGKGYSQEISLPWRLLSKDREPLKAGDELTLTVEFNFCRKEGGRVSVKDVFEPEVWIDRSSTYDASHCWGTAVLEPNGNVPPHPVRLSDGREATVQMKDGAPVVDWASLPEKKAPPADVPEGAKPRLTVRARPITLVSMRGDKSGFTPFDSACEWYRHIGLMAPDPARIEGKNYDFVRWEIDGASRRAGRNSIKITMDKDRVATAVYQIAGDEAGAPATSTVAGEEDSAAVSGSDASEAEASLKSSDRAATPLVAAAPGFVGRRFGLGWDAILIGLLAAVLAAFGLMVRRAGRA
ncbi:MAG: hypothetical protein HQ592_04165, partial [Planctomycetes bacterium]|nr:hypothetical protein [Planctomycetota bacterium]